MSVSIYQIAKEAGVSSSTVARALRGETKAVRRDSIERVERIRNIAERLGYEQSWKAKALSSGRTHAIGLVNSHSDWIFEGVMGEIASSFTDALRDLGYHLVLVPLDEEGGWKELLTGGRLDGIAILHHYPTEGQGFLEKCELPTVLLGDDTDRSAPQVVFDDKQGAILATNHLIDLGHREIGFYIEQGAREHHSVTDRIAGYRQALKEAGLGEGTVWRVTEQELASRLVDRDPSPTAVVCYCHVEAQVLTQTLWRSGRTVPDSMSVVAFNDLPQVTYMNPPLTTIGYDTRLSGVTGARMLASLIRGEQPPQERVKIPPQLVLRESTSPR
ncbi:HTH-type transcriptional regulator DegA [Planctomycetes bacterium MalM25]|nr:HTH-type transcriptional regulator DegA [Planctomycetes bacterium MalM25]